MARDGSGTYDRVHADYVDGTTIEADDINGELNDMASALTQSLSKDGQTTPTANIPMGGFKLTGLARGTGTGDTARYDELILAARAMLSGLTLSRTSATVIGVTAGACAESGNTSIISLSSSGSIDCATTGANGLDTGSLANNTWYHAYTIAKADGTAARLASTSVSSPTMPSGYTLKRRIGSFKTNGSAQIIDFTQVGDNFRWAAGVADIVSDAPSTSGNYTMSVPTGVAVLWVGTVKMSYTSGSGSAVLAIVTPGQTVPAGTAHVGAVASANFTDQGGVRMLTNTSAQVGYVASGTGSLVVSIDATTLGWVDRRGRDD